ncbi:hypothetical protein F511_28842 [Dorcoceras hygrometricum]|uniref:Uncharacterized protein n=1 Tax=Dorcoceras hygrometricum TaxID=472368 RepID=A0A2Z7CA56_9LAMI|nr:hypothetical protein F511_28842 [Dorcoceras hygrometricum]
MASSLIHNASQIYFDPVYGIDYEGMVQVFKALESSGLRRFLGCSSAIYEAALVDFFRNASVRDGKVVSTVQGKAVDITEEVFDGTFDLSTDGLTKMSEVPKYLVFYARSAFYMGGEQLKTSYKKREMKYEFHLLNDILAKTVTVKAGSFDAVTYERFLMMSAIHGGVKGAPDLEMGESKEFLPHKILTAKTVGTYVAKNKNIAVEKVTDEPVVKKATPKRRPAPAVGELIDKKKRTCGENCSRREGTEDGPSGSDDEIVDSIIHQVIADTAAIESGEPDLGEPDLGEPYLGERYLEEPVVVETSETMAIETENRVVLVNNDVLRKEIKAQKSALSFSCGDAKKGEMSSSQGPRPPPDDRNRPGSGDSGRGRGSSSEPPNKRGGGSRGSSSSRGFRYWFGE